MCLELVGRAIKDEKYLRRLKIPEAFWPLLSESWRRRDASLYGRLDLSYDGWSPAKLLEYNADTPTSISRLRFFSGPGSNRRWNATSSRSAPTSSIQSMNA